MPITRVVTLRVTDEDGHGEARSSVYTMRIHAPAENPNLVVSAPLLSDSFVDTNTVTIPYGGVPISETYEFQAKVSVSATLSLGSEFTAKLFETKINVAVTGTAEVSYKRSVTSNFTPSTIPGTAMRWWFRRRAWYRTLDASWDAYDAHGFNSKTSTSGITFKSSNAVEAAANDFDDQQMHEVVPIG